MYCFMENQTIGVMFMMHVGGVEMPSVVGGALAPFALSGNYVHSLKKIAHLLLGKLFDIFVNNLYELLDKPIIWLPLKWMGDIGPKGLILQIASSSFDSIILSR